MAGYDEHSISVLEGLEAVRKKTGNVYRKCMSIWQGHVIRSMSHWRRMVPVR